MNKEKWNAFVKKLSAGCRKVSLGTAAVILAVFAMVGIASAVNVGNTTIAEYLYSNEQSADQNGIRELLTQHILSGEPKMAATVLQYAYSGVTDLGTQTMSYTATSTYEDYRGVGSFYIPGTKKTIEVECPGSVTAYYKADDVTWNADAASRIIYVTLPARIYVENILNEDEMTRVDTDNFLNRIKESDLEACVEKLKEEGLAQVVAEGIYELVAESARETITETFSILKNYGVSFESSATLGIGETGEVYDPQEVKPEEEDTAEADEDTQDAEESADSGEINESDEKENWYDYLWGSGSGSGYGFGDYGSGSGSQYGDSGSNYEPGDFGYGSGYGSGHDSGYGSDYGNESGGFGGSDPYDNSGNAWNSYLNGNENSSGWGWQDAWNSIKDWGRGVVQ